MSKSTRQKAVQALLTGFIWGAMTSGVVFAAVILYRFITGG